MSQTSERFAEHIAIVGGGRWARVVASVLCEIAPQETRLSVCSERNPAGWEEWLHNRPEDASGRVQIAWEPAQLLNDRSLGLVIVARAARNNAATAIAALKADKPVLVEKPFALNLPEAEQVVAAAAGQQACATGLVFLFATNLHRFAGSIKDIGPMTEMRIEWHDPRNETRHSESKGYDPSLNCMLDVFPHIWSLLRLIGSDLPLEACNAQATEGGRRVSLKLTLGDAAITVDIAREADARRRSIQVFGADGEGSIDFTSEPGAATVLGKEIDVATGFSSPLARELEYAVCGMPETPTARFCRVAQAIEAIALGAEFLPQVRREQFRQIASGLVTGANSNEHNAAEYALNELILDRAWNHGHGDGNPAWETPVEILQSAVRGWLRGDAADSDVPVCIRNDPGFAELKRRLARAANS